MPRAGEASGGSRVVRTMTRDDLDPACRIMVAQGLCAADGLPQRLSATLGMANADYLVTEEDGAIVGVALSSMVSPASSATWPSPRARSDGASGVG